MALSIKLDRDIEIRLNDLANKTGRTKTYYIREAINKHMEDLEDLYIADKRMAMYINGQNNIVPLEEVLLAYGVGN